MKPVLTAAVRWQPARSTSTLTNYSDLPHSPVRSRWTCPPASRAAGQRVVRRPGAGRDPTVAFTVTNTDDSPADVQPGRRRRRLRLHDRPPRADGADEHDQAGARAGADDDDRRGGERRRRSTAAVGCRGVRRRAARPQPALGGHAVHQRGRLLGDRARHAVRRRPLRRRRGDRRRARHGARPERLQAALAHGLGRARHRPERRRRRTPRRRSRPACCPTTAPRAARATSATPTTTRARVRETAPGHGGGDDGRRRRTPATSIEAKIPATSLPGDGRPATHMGFNAFVYDSDTQDKTGQTRIGWSTWGGVQGDPYRWGRASLDGLRAAGRDVRRAGGAGDPVRGAAGAGLAADHRPGGAHRRRARRARRPSSPDEAAWVEKAKVRGDRCR